MDIICIILKKYPNIFFIISIFIFNENITWSKSRR